MMSRAATLRLANLLAFQAGWLACVLGAAQGVPWAGPTTVAALLGLQLWFLPEPARFSRFLLVCGLFGFTLDTALARLGAFAFHGPLLPGLPAWLCPPWLMALWMLFASTLPLSLDWLAARPWLAAFLGATAGPLSYYAGASLGALDLAGEPRTSLLILAVIWGILLPALLRLKTNMELTLLPAS